MTNHKKKNTTENKGKSRTSGTASVTKHHKLQKEDATTKTHASSTSSSRISNNKNGSSKS